jgi:hypothetical protein
VDAFVAFLRRRLGLVALLLTSLLAARTSGPAVPPATVEGLTALLGQSVGGTVDAADLAWEPSGGFAADALFGRAILFLARREAGAPRDLYRARVRLGLDGRPARVLSAHDLTRTPLGDDGGLQVVGRTAAVATSAFGNIQGVSIFEIGRAHGGDAGWLDRWLARSSAWRQTGAIEGVRRTDFVLEVPRASAKLRLGPSSLEVQLGAGDPGVLIDLAQRQARAVGGGPIEEGRVLFRPAPSKPVVAWLADELRARIGPARVAWLEHRLFGARDSLRRVVDATFGGGARLRDDVPDERHPGRDVTWPPPAIPSIFAQPDEGEGRWAPIERPWLPASSVDAPPYFQRTFVRPDPERPYARVQLVALDMRQLEVRMVAGYEEPEPLVGPPGSGRLPEAPREYRRVAAVFNGAFKNAHGEYGMMVGRRVLVPPVSGAATIVRTHDGELGFGTWPDTKALPGDVVSFRQNLDPLVADGVANPAHREAWGWQIAGTEVQTERTALCVTESGQVLYAWGNVVSGPTLARTLARAGCDYAVHLDMNPTHCGFVLTGIDDLEQHAGHTELVEAGMSYPEGRALGWSPKDFFYVRVRDPMPPPVLGETWHPVGRQPDPEWLPGLFETRVTLGELSVRVVSFEKGRFDWRVRAGEREPSHAGAAPKKTALGADEQRRVRVRVGLGRTTARTGYGLSFGVKASLELRRAYATLILPPGGAPRLFPPGQLPELRADTEAVQLPIIARDGDVLASARRRGARRARGGLCVTPFGRVLYAEVEHDSDDPVAKVLLAAGCRDVLATDRGSRHPAVVRLGEGEPGTAETTLLYGLSRPGQPHAFAWHPAARAR